MSLIDELKTTLNRDIENLGYLLWGIEVSGNHSSKHIRIFIDNEDSSITLEDCTKVNVQAREVLENSETFNFDYSLEISSPGIDRTFFDLNQLQDYLEETIQIKFETDSQKQTVTGKLLSISSDYIEIENKNENIIKIKTSSYQTSKLIYKV
jgi:ribosome maturation factor RimP